MKVRTFIVSDEEQSAEGLCKDQNMEEHGDMDVEMVDDNGVDGIEGANENASQGADKGVDGVANENADENADEGVIENVDSKDFEVEEEEWAVFGEFDLYLWAALIKC